MLRNLVNGLQRLFRLVGDFFFGELFIVELDNFLDGAHALAQVVADGNQFLDDNRGARDRAHHHKLPALDALGDSDFALARQQRDGAHLAQVHAYRIVGLFQRTRRQIQIRFAFVRVFLGDAFVIAALGGHFDRARRLRRRLIFVNLDAVALERVEQIVDFFRGVHFRGKRIVHFVVQQVPTLLADGYELAYRIVFFFKPYSCHKFPPKILFASLSQPRFVPVSPRRPNSHTARRSLRLLAETQTGWRNGANHGDIPTRSLLFCLNPSVPCRSFAAAPCVARSRTSGGPAPAAKYINIDAFSCKSVTRRNLGTLHG